MCFQAGFEVDRGDELTDDRLLALVDECAALGVREWVIAGGGEPMLRGDVVVQLCERIRSYEMNGVIQTNGVTFQSEHFARLMEVGWSTVAVSLDGPTREINDAIRCPGAFEKATATVRKLAALKRERGVAQPVLSIFGVVTAYNYERLAEFVSFVHALGCDAVGLGQLIVHGPSNRYLEVPAERLGELMANVEAARRCAEELGLDHNFHALLGTEAEEASGRHAIRGARSSCCLAHAVCFEPWLSLLVCADGKVSPCCRLWDVDDEGLAERSLADLWRESPYLQAVRQALSSGRPLPPCAQCPPDLRSRNEALRPLLAWAQQSTPRRLGLLAAKAVASTRRHGLRRALERGREWLRIMR